MPKVRTHPHPLDDPALPEHQKGMRRACSEVIRTTRARVGWTQRALSAASGVSLSTVAKAEQARQNLSMDTLVELMFTMGFGIGFVVYPTGDDMLDRVSTWLKLDLQNTDEKDDHPPTREEDDAPVPTDPTDPADKTEEELEQEIIREITRVRTRTSTPTAGGVS